jgi:flavin reductase (DIM6/NTAB) family NADH-FMN oxidoreductase RutF
MNNLQFDPFEKFNSDWALLAAGPAANCNAMTISWGSMGTVWGKPVITVYVRPDRYTWQFLKDYDTFTVSFYPEAQRPALMKMGTLSGRDGDKAAESGLTPKDLGGCVTFAEANQTFVCKKIYMNQLNRDAVPEDARQIYQNGIEPHWLIMGEVTEVLPASG